MSEQLAHIQLTNVGDYANVESGTTDDMLIEMWLNKRKSDNTKNAYLNDIGFFRQHVSKPLQSVIYADLDAFSQMVNVSNAKESTKARAHNAVKSLFSLAMKLGYIRMNPAAILDTPKVPSELAARILTQEQVMKMLSLEEDPRNRVILRLLYESAVRVSELCNLTWSGVQTNARTGGQVTVHGKGGKTRSIPISQTAYDMLLGLRDGAGLDDSVFVSETRGTALSRVSVYKIVAAAASRAGISGKVSPHWLRHAHASHALDRGAPIQLVKETLGHANIATTNNYAHAKPNESSSTYLFTF